MAITSDPVGELLELLLSCEEGLRAKGLKKLERLSRKRPTAAVGVRLLEAAAHVKPCPNLIWPDDASNKLVAAVFEHPHPEYYPIIERNFDAYAEDAKGYALAMLTEEATGEGLDVFWRIAEPRAHDPTFQWFGRTETTLANRQDAVGLPLAELLSEELSTWMFCSIGRISLQHLKHGWLEPGRLTKKSTGLLRRTELAIARIQAHQSDGEEWIWADEYQEHRDEVSILLDLLGFMNTQDSRKTLRQTKAQVKDPKLKYFAEMSLLRLGEPPDEITLNEVAKCPGMRGWLYKTLCEMKSESLIQPQWRTQDALAEAHMVEWLIFPTELGRPPHEIVKLGVIQLTVDDEVRDFYVYRFRTFEPHWAASDGWMVGWSGPYSRDDSPQWHGSHTFSAFQPWDGSLPLEAFIEGIGSYVIPE
jgi:hypothetical protein